MQKQAHRSGGGIDPTHLQLSARKRCVVNTKPRPFYRLEKTGTHCTRDCVDLWTGLD